MEDVEELDQVELYEWEEFFKERKQEEREFQMAIHGAKKT